MLNTPKTWCGNQARHQTTRTRYHRTLHLANSALTAGLDSGDRPVVLDGTAPVNLSKGFRNVTERRFYSPCPRALRARERHFRPARYPRIMAGRERGSGPGGRQPRAQLRGSPLSSPHAPVLTRRWAARLGCSSSPASLGHIDASSAIDDAARRGASAQPSLRQRWSSESIRSTRTRPSASACWSSARRVSRPSGLRR
jgi:hypothetical protein